MASVSTSRREWVPLLIDALPDERERIVLSRVFKGATLREVGQELGISHPTQVARLRDRAIDRLRVAFDALDAHYEELRRQAERGAVNARCERRSTSALRHD